MAESDFSIEIDKNAVSETKSFSNPPPALKQVFTATALLLGHPEKHAQVSVFFFVNAISNLTNSHTLYTHECKV